MRARLAIAAVLSALTVAVPATVEASPNGQLTADELSPAATGIHCDGLRGQLANPAAAAYNSAALSVGRNLPSNGCASLYRPLGKPLDGCSAGTQWGMWNCYGPGRAAFPSTSNHGLGRAGDLPPDTRAVFNNSGGLFGFYKPCSDAAHEIWHLAYCASFNRPDPGVNLVSPTLRRGSGGPGQAKFVRQWQHLMRRAGARYIAVDGDFGKKTARATKKWQKAHNLKPDGVVGPHSWKVARGPVTRDRERLVQYSFSVSGPVNGVDVSQHQGSVNWSAVRAAGYEFACPKASEGANYVDPYWNQARVQALHQQGLRICPYHYVRPTPGRSGAVEGAFFVQAIQAAGWGEGDLLPALDIEESALPPAQTCTYLRQVVRTVRKQIDAKPIIYTGQFAPVSAQMLASCPNLGDWLRQKPLWIAAPGVPDPYTGPWASFTIRQTTFTGRVPGIAGDVDLDVIPGGKAALATLRYSAEGAGHGGDPDDGTRDPVDGQHRNRPPCSSKARPHRCHLRRRCDRGHRLACQRVRALGRVDAAVGEALGYLPTLEVGE